MKPETVRSWRYVMGILDHEVHMAEQSAHLNPNDTTRALRDAWKQAQTAVARKLAKMMLTGEEEPDAADAG